MAAFAPYVALPRPRPLVRAQTRACAVEPDFFAPLLSASRARLEAQGLGISSMEWKNGVLSVYVARAAELAGDLEADGASIEDCGFANAVLDDVLEGDVGPAGAFTLEVSTPGTGEFLQREREFVAFKGFDVEVKTGVSFKKKSVFQGTLLARDEAVVKVNVKGRVVAIPRDIVASVRLSTAPQSE